MSDEAIRLKDEGNAKFKERKFEEAIELYTRVIELLPENHVCYSNRSAAYLSLSKPEQALVDARKCVEMAPEFVKGYLRLAGALQSLNRCDEALEVCNDGLKVSPDDALMKRKAEVQAKLFTEQLQGTWHGIVSQVLGGYGQEMEFLDSSSLRVSVMGRTIVGGYWLDCSQVPYHLNIQVPAKDVPSNIPTPPPVPYIARIDEKGLHLCCPYLKLDRPTAFEGEGYCLMERGSLEKIDQSDVANLSKEEKLRRCAEDLCNALPDRKLEQPNATDPENVVGDKIMAQVRLESSMYSVTLKYGEEVFQEVVQSANSKNLAPSATLALSKELQRLKEKLKLCGFSEDDVPPGEESPLSRPPRPEATDRDFSPGRPGATSADGKNAGSSEVLDAKGADSSQAAGTAALSPVVTAAIIAAAAVVISVFAWRRRKA